MSYHLILNSQGLNTDMGVRLIQKSLDFLGKSAEKEKMLLVSKDTAPRRQWIVDGCIRLGISEENIISVEQLKGNKELAFSVSLVYVGEGNVFEVLNYIKKMQVEEEIRQIVFRGGIYIGSSAGAMIAGDDILLGHDFDEDKISVSDPAGLRLFSGTILPHYSYKNLKQYEKYTDQKILQKYETIYSVNDGEVLMLEMENGSVRKKKRFRFLL